MTDTPPPLPPRVWLVDVQERVDYVVRVDQATLGLPAHATDDDVRAALRVTADLMVANTHPEAARSYTERTVGDMSPCAPAGT
jgi:hypothetical protein